MESPLLLIELGAVILGLGLLGRVAGWIGLSPIPLYLLGGLAFGSGGLVPISASETFISAGASIGVVLLLLTLGLEYSADELTTELRRHAPAGGVDLVLNATPGVLAGLLLGWGPVAAVALGGVTYVTSSGVTSKLLGDLGWLGNRETPTVLSMLVMEDLAMALYLPLLTSLLLGAGLLGGFLGLVSAVVALVVVLVVALRYGRFLARFVSGPSNEVLLLTVLGLTLLVAGAAEKVHVSAAVGAFLIGIALSGPVAENARTILSPLRDLFAAVFFVFFGLQTSPAAIVPILPVAALLALVSAVTKMATGYFAARRGGIGPVGRVRAGAALIPHGEFSIVVAGLAVGAGLEPALRSLAAAYVLLLAILGPVAAKGAEPGMRRLLRWRREREQGHRQRAIPS